VKKYLEIEKKYPKAEKMKFKLSHNRLAKYRKVVGIKRVYLLYSVYITGVEM